METRATTLEIGVSLARRLSVAIGGPAAVTLLALPADPPTHSVAAVLYLLAVVFAARVGGASGGLLASGLSFLALNFFFTEPLHTLTVGEAEDLVALFAFLVAAIVVGVLLSSTLQAKSEAQHRELEVRMLNRLATRLLAGEPTVQVLTEFAEGICDLFGLMGCEITASFVPKVTVSRGDLSAATDHLRLRARGQDLGEMKLWVPTGSLGASERAVIESLAAQLALALEGMRLAHEFRRAELEAQASQLKAALFSGVTHDVKTPLAAITASVTSLIDDQGFSATDRSEHLETIRHEADRLNRVVNNLLDLARLRAGALVPIKAPNLIDELMESVLNRLRPMLGARDVEIRVSKDVPEVPMDVVQIDQVLTNLVENAVKFTPPDAPISLSAVGDATKVRVTVADRGPGLDAHDHARIFEPFERRTESQDGTGLGLAICKAIVSAHGGRIWVSENPHGGASFTFELPGAASDDGGVPSPTG